MGIPVESFPGLPRRDGLLRSIALTKLIPGLLIYSVTGEMEVIRLQLPFAGFRFPAINFRCLRCSDIPVGSITGLVEMFRALASEGLGALAPLGRCCSSAARPERGGEGPLRGGSHDGRRRRRGPSDMILLPAVCEILRTRFQTACSCSGAPASLVSILRFKFRFGSILAKVRAEGASCPWLPGHTASLSCL